MYTSRKSNSGDVLVKWTFNFKFKYTLTNTIYPSSIFKTGFGGRKK